MENIFHAISTIQGMIGPVATAFVLMMVAIGGFLKSIEAIIQVIAPLTPWKWDDNLATLLGKLLANKIFNKKE